MRSRSWWLFPASSGAIFVTIVTTIACVPQPAPPTGGGGFGGGTIRPPTSNTNTNRNRNQNQNSDAGPPRPSNSNQNPNANVGPNPNGNGNTNSNANSNSNTNTDTNTNSPPGAPVLGALSNVTIPECESFQSEPIPLISGNTPLTWTIVRGPPRMTISSRTRRVTWSDPILSLSPVYTVEVRASNSVGQGTTTFMVTVEPTIAHTIARLSVLPAGGEPDKDAAQPAISDDGDRVVFQSEAGGFVANDLNLRTDIFLVDRRAQTLRRVSQTASGAEADVPSIRPRISRDGRFVAFQSFSEIFVAGDNNGTADIFVVELDTGNFEIASRNAAGEIGNSGSDDPSLSSDGRFVAFTSAASNLVAGDLNNTNDIFVRDRQTSTTTRVSVSTAGVETVGPLNYAGSTAPRISADGQAVVFVSDATNLIATDGNNSSDIFVHDRTTAGTARVSVRSDGTESAGSYSSPAIGGAANEFVVFVTTAQLAVLDSNTHEDIYIHNRQTGTTELVSIAPGGFSAGNGPSRNPSISPDGRYVVFSSIADDLIPNDDNNTDDVFVLDRQSNTMRVASENDDGALGDGPSTFGNLAGDGVTIVIESKATNFTCPDDNELADVFVKTLAP